MLQQQYSFDPNFQAYNYNPNYNPYPVYGYDQIGYQQAPVFDYQSPQVPQGSGHKHRSNNYN